MSIAGPPVLLRAFSASAPARGGAVRKRAIALASMAGVIGVLLWYAPAAWMGNLVAGATQNRVILMDPRGTLWAGSARVRLSGGAAASPDAIELPDRLGWRVVPQWWSAGLGQTTVMLTSAALTPRGAMRLRLHALQLWRQSPSHGVSIEVPELRLPAAVLGGLGAPWNTLALQGEITLQASMVQLLRPSGVWQVTGEAKAHIHQLGTALSGVRPLGSYALQLQADRLSLHTIEDATTGHSALLLRGSGQLVGTGLRLSGEAVAAPGMHAALAHLLHVIGQRQDAPDGRARAIWEIKV